jgi:hypothetical protein
MRHRRLARLRLALELTAGMLGAQTWSWGHHPFGDAHASLVWLRAQLAPLAVHDRDLQGILLILDPERPPRPWSTPKGAKRELLRLGAMAQAFA